MLRRKKFVPGQILKTKKLRGKTQIEHELERLHDIAHPDFPAAAERLYRHIAEMDKTSREKLGFKWYFWGETNLRDYARPLDINLDEYLEKRILRAIKNGKKLKILEIGIGSGDQWVEFLKKYGKSVEFFATNFSEGGLSPNASKQIEKGHSIVISKASELSKYFEANYFDVIIARSSLHYEEYQGLEQIIHLLKPNGEGMVISPKSYHGLIETTPDYEFVERKKWMPNLKWQTLSKEEQKKRPRLLEGIRIRKKRKTG